MLPLKVFYHVFSKMLVMIHYLYASIKNVLSRFLEDLGYDTIKVFYHACRCYNVCVPYTTE